MLCSNRIPMCMLIKFKVVYIIELKIEQNPVYGMHVMHHNNTIQLPHNKFLDLNLNNTNLKVITIKIINVFVTVQGTGLAQQLLGPRLVKLFQFVLGLFVDF